MNAKQRLGSLLSTAAVALVALGTTLSANAAKCASPQDFGERAACAAAKEGVDALRQYVNRTRMIHRLRVQDFESALPPTSQATGREPTKVAIAK